MRKSVAVAAAGICIGVGALGVTYGLTPEPSIKHTTALNAILDARLLIAAGRLLILVGIAYLLASIVVRVHRGQWVRGAGPVETDAPAQALVDDQEDLQQQLEEAKVTIDDLRERLARCLDGKH